MQFFRGLMMPIVSRMLTDIMSCLVETTAEQREDIARLRDSAFAEIKRIGFCYAYWMDMLNELTAKCFDVSTKK